MTAVSPAFFKAARQLDSFAIRKSGMAAGCSRLKRSSSLKPKRALRTQAECETASVEGASSRYHTPRSSSYSSGAASTLSTSADVTLWRPSAPCEKSRCFSGPTLARQDEATRGSRCAGRSALRAQASAHRLARIMSCEFDVRDDLDHQTLAAFESTSTSGRSPVRVRREHVGPEASWKARPAERLHFCCSCEQYHVIATPLAACSFNCCRLVPCG